MIIANIDGHLHLGLPIAVGDCSVFSAIYCSSQSTAF